ncbi:MAG: DUF1269 domain-containing protein [Thermomicrobiales bacterium]
MADPTDIVIATFDEESKTFQVFSEIKHLATTRKIQLEGLAIVRRTEDGRMETPEIINTNQRSALTGGLVGSVVGILGGPLGVLLGWGTGALLGSLKDFNEVRSDISVLQSLSEGMNPGSVALIGEVATTSANDIRRIVHRHGGELLRRPAAEIEEEIRQAHKAHNAASEEAKRTFGLGRDSSTSDS